MERESGPTPEEMGLQQEETKPELSEEHLPSPLVNESTKKDGSSEQQPFVIRQMKEYRRKGLESVGAKEDEAYVVAWFRKTFGRKEKPSTSSEEYHE